MGDTYMARGTEDDLRDQLRQTEADAEALTKQLGEAQAVIRMWLADRRASMMAGVNCRGDEETCPCLICRSERVLE